MRVPIATLLVGALLAGGCTPSANAPVNPSSATTPFTAPVVTLTAPVKHLIGLTSTTRVGLFGEAPVYPLYQLPKVPTNYGQLGVVYWGTRDPANGEINGLTQAQVIGIDGAQSQHIWFYNDRPIIVRDDASGYSLVMVEQQNLQTVVTLCDGKQDAIAHVTMLSYGKTPQLGPVADGGSCMVFIAVPGQRRTRARAEKSLLKQVAGVQRQIDSTPYIAGLADAIGAITQHKDNPTISKAVVLLFVAAALIFIPAILKSISSTTFDSNPSEVDGVTPFYAK